MLNSSTPVAGSTPPTGTAELSPAPAGTAVPASAWAWAGFAGFRNPAVVLITIYVFMPYYVASMAGRPVEGQALIARAGQVAGKAVAFTAPLPGVTVDRLGPRKPARTMTVLAMVPLYWAMWFVPRHGPIGPGVFVALAAAKFSSARMLHVDGTPAILLFSGMLAAGTMGWETLEMLA